MYEPSHPLCGLMSMFRRAASKHYLRGNTHHGLHAETGPDVDSCIRLVKDTVGFEHDVIDVVGGEGAKIDY